MKKIICIVYAALLAGCGSPKSPPTDEGSIDCNVWYYSKCYYSNQYVCIKDDLKTQINEKCVSNVDDSVLDCVFLCDGKP